MTENPSHDEFLRKHPLIAGLLFTLMLMPGIYFATGAHKTGVPSLGQLALIVLLVAPITGYLLKYFASRRVK
jgi:hypothetical protein